MSLLGNSALSSPCPVPDVTEVEVVAVPPHLLQGGAVRGVSGPWGTQRKVSCSLGAPGGRGEQVDQLDAMSPRVVSVGRQAHGRLLTEAE